MIDLYPEPPQAAIETAVRLSIDHACDRCSLSAGCKSICIPADGDPGGVLIIGEAPGRSEDFAGRPFVGTSGAYIRRLVDEYYTGNVVYANAINCTPGNISVTDKHLDTCRSYLAKTLDDAKPERIICLGTSAVYSVLGQNVSVLSTRRGYAFLSDGTPIFMLISPVMALRNRFLNNQFESDFKWALTCKAPIPEWDGVARLVRLGDDGFTSWRTLMNAQYVTFDCETYGLLWEKDFQVISVAVIANGQDEVWLWDKDALKNPDTLQLLEDVLTTVPVAGQNLMFDLQAVRCGLEINIPRDHVYADTMIMRHLIDAEAEANLATMAYLVGMGGHKDEAMVYVTNALKKPTKKSAIDLLLEQRERGVDLKAYAYAQIPKDILNRYNARDTLTTDKLVNIFTKKLSTLPEAENIHNQIVKHLPYTFSKLQEWGFAVDRAAVEMFGDHLRGELEITKRNLQSFGDFDPGSPKQVADLLFNKMGITPPKYSKRTGAPSTDAEVLQTLAGKYPVVDFLLKHRHLIKLSGTYADGEDGKSGIIPHIREDGRVHPSYHPTGARTGRPSCSNPNLLNIPRAENPEGIMARNQFVAAPGKILLIKDFSQIELRIAAMLSGDPVMKKIYKDGVDYHAETARLIAKDIWGVDYDAASPEKQKEMRTKAKTANFLSAYDGTPEGLAKKLNCSIRDAEKLQNAILGKFQQFASWSTDQIHYTTRTGQSWSWWDGQRARRRPMWLIADPEGTVRSRAQHGAVNGPIQGTASEFCMASLIAVVNWIEDENLEADVKIITSVYDSIVLEVTEKLLKQVSDHVEKIMLSWNSLDVPIEVDTEIGYAWGSMKKMEVT